MENDLMKAQIEETKEAIIWLGKPIGSLILVVVERVRRGKKIGLERTKVLRRGVIPLIAERRRRHPPYIVPQNLYLGKGNIVSQWPNRRTMVLRENVEHKSLLSVSKMLYHSSCENSSSSSEEKSSSEGSHYEEDLLMGELVVDRKVSLAITFGSYKDDILYDVVPMEATHIVLGRSWQFDRKMTHDGVSNRLSFV
ncbi:hypothetical protein CR513_35813, partial [Mucuna pruriens]